MKIPSIRPADPVDSAAVVVDVAVTLADQVRFSEHMRDRPETRRRRRTFLAVMLLVGPAIGLLIGLLLSSGGPSLSDIVRDGPAWWWLLPILASLLISGAIALIAMAFGWTRRPLLRWQLRRVLAQRPGVDAKDPEVRERCRCTFDAQGYSTQGQSTRVQMDWSVIRGLDEVDGLFILRVGPLAGFILPLRDMSDEQAEAIRAIVRHHLGAEGRGDA